MTDKPKESPKISPEASAWAKQFDELDTRNKIDALEAIRKNPTMKHVLPKVLEMLMECYQLLMEDAYEELKRISNGH